MRRSRNTTKRPLCRKCRKRQVARPGQVCAACKPKKSSSGDGHAHTGRAADVLARTSYLLAHPPTEESLVTTTTFVWRWLERHNVTTTNDLTDPEYRALFQHCDALSERYHAIFGQQRSLAET